MFTMKSSGLRHQCPDMIGLIFDIVLVDNVTLIIFSILTLLQDSFSSF